MTGQPNTAQTTAHPNRPNHPPLPPTSEPWNSNTPRYQLEVTERIHTAQDDAAYGCMAWQPDPDGVHGVYLGESRGRRLSTDCGGGCEMVAAVVVVVAR